MVATTYEGPGVRGPRRDLRAARVFVVVALYLAVVTLLVFAFATPRPPIVGPVALIGPALSVITLLIAAAGLAWGRAWAYRAMTPLLVLLVVAGLISVALALLRLSLEIPLGAVLALWALRAPIPAGASPVSGQARGPVLVAALAVAALAVAVAWPLIAAVVLRPGGLLVAGDMAVSTNMTVRGDCLASADAPGGTAPESMDVTFTWSWLQPEPWPAGTDLITLTWFTMRDGGLSGYRLESVAAVGEGIVESNRWEDMRSRSNITFAVDLGRRQFSPGEVTVTLRRPEAVPAGHGSVELYGQYVHGPASVYDAETPAVWRTHDVQARCEW